eukprot:GEMP01004337.1.p1 GENE.GEMP01004337.1~~GEMP01004337.1.p1  ORF type:complete len:517 (-),score=127.71 GEMP01004337.1:2509-4059(-)
MSSFEDRVLERRRQFKKAVDGDDARRLREDEAVQLRKKDKEEQLAKKRFQDESTLTTSPSMPSTPLAGADLQTLVNAVRNYQDPQNQFLASQTIRKQLSIENLPPIQQVIDTGVVPDFINLLSTNRADIQFEAAWALTNIASGTHEQTHVVIQAGAVPVFVRLLEEATTDEVKDQAVWALGNIAGDSAGCRDLVLQFGALEPVAALCRVDKQSMQRNATWTLSNFCRGKPAPNLLVIKPALRTLTLLAHSKDVDVLTDTCWALSYFTEGDPQRIAALLESGVLRRIVDLLGHSSSSVQVPALRVIGNVVTGNDDQTQTAIQCGCLPALRNLIQHTKKTIRKEACWAISNITAGNARQIQEVIVADLIPPLLQLLKEADFDVKKEVCWAISNASSGGTAEQVHTIVTNGAIPPLVEILATRDTKLLPVVLEALQNILKIGKMLMEQNDRTVNEYCVMIEQCGLEKIENLQEGHSTEIYEKVVKILGYFQLEDDDGMLVSEEFPEFGVRAPSQGFHFG